MKYLLILLTVLSTTTFASEGNKRGHSEVLQQGQAQGQAQGQVQGQAQQITGSGNSSISEGAVSNTVTGGSISEGAVQNSVSSSIGEGAVQTDNQSSTTTTVSNDNGDDIDIPSMVPASVMAGECQQGAGGQVSGGGFNVVTSTALCDQLKISVAMRAAAEYETARGDLVKAAEYTVMSHTALENANHLVQDTKYTGLVNRVGGELVIPAALIAGLILLL